MNKEPVILHIELGNQHLSKWLKENRYIIYSELIRYSEKLIKEKIQIIQAIIVSNLYDNIVFIIKRDNVKLTLDKAMEYFLSIEEFEKCAEIRDLNILIQNLENETANIKISKSNKRGLESNR
jgi:transcription initiation factor IIE alpha subunit